MVEFCSVSESSRPLPWLPSAEWGPVAIAATDIQMVFRSGLSQVKVLKGVDLTVNQGEIRLLMGPSGSGKTTLLSILAGILTPTAGQVALLGHKITQMSRQDRTRFRRHHLGFVFQDFNLFPALTAAENIELALKIKDYPKSAIAARARTLLSQVDLADVSQRLPQDLSGGQKQRVAIARALAGEPQILMADEPTAALDSKTGRAVVELMNALAREQGCTVLIITHDPRITDIADRITYLEDGHISESPSWGS
ncbi:ABC transporter ATP-binding protein [Halomicronema hongdechloris C2206]|uniref:ABC transporter ATP-binding protein n=1 Tax=Halomicronema hongdechloris C2206 TaxID=1641165 RepID=A0A1Z3HM72_9CYAN|nr:ABC transporter ATP-binding protein [Halomicronema hongdechloris]ASC71366.1 ABC transporter ATP-binding protein [Halomicronema hongdechloris C2206]